MRAPPLLTAVALVAVTLTAPALARASGDDTPATTPGSEVLVEQGLTLREKGQDREALALFEQAAALAPSPRITAQVGLAEQALGRWIDAEGALSRALEAADDPWIARNRPPLLQALETVRAQLAWLEVETTAPGATLWIDGHEVTTLPQPTPVRVVAGSHDVEVRAPGHEPAVRRVTVTAGEHAHEILTPSMASIPGPAPAPPASSVPPTEPIVASPSGVDGTTLGWVLAGSSVVLLAGGVTANVVRQQAAQTYDDDAQCLVPGRTRDQVCGSYRTTVDVTTGLAIAGYGAGAAAALASLYFFLRHEGPAPASASVGGCRLGVASAQCVLAF